MEAWFDARMHAGKRTLLPKSGIHNRPRASCAGLRTKSRHTPRCTSEGERGEQSTVMEFASRIDGRDVPGHALSSSTGQADHHRAIKARPRADEVLAAAAGSPAGNPSQCTVPISALRTTLITTRLSYLRKHQPAPSTPESRTRSMLWARMPTCRSTLNRCSRRCAPASRS
jgi:hypothetical protein